MVLYVQRLTTVIGKLMRVKLRFQGTRWAATLGASGRRRQHIEQRLSKALASSKGDVAGLNINFYMCLTSARESEPNALFDANDIRGSTTMPFEWSVYLDER